MLGVADYFPRLRCANAACAATPDRIVRDSEADETDMNFDAKAFLDQAMPWVMAHWQLLVAVIVGLFLLSILRKLLRRSPAPRVAAAPANNGQTLETALAAGAEVNADLESYARTLFSEDFAGHAVRISGDAPRPVRFATIAEAPFVYDGVIMRDVAMLPGKVIAPVSAHFRQAQNLRDALRRLGGLNPADASPAERMAALRASITELQGAVEKACDAAEKLDAAISKAGGSLTVSRSLLDLGTDAFKGMSVDRPGQRAKFYKVMREQAGARAREILSSLDATRVKNVTVALPAVEPVTKDMRPAAE